MFGVLSATSRRHVLRRMERRRSFSVRFEAGERGAEEDVGERGTEADERETEEEEA